MLCPLICDQVKRQLKWFLGGGASILVAIQFANPARTNPPVTPGRGFLASNAPPPEVAAILRDACYDCHSDETRWPWYSRVAPVSWFVANHVKDGRRHLNFSDWPNGESLREVQKLRHIRGQVSSGKRPLPSYTWIHTSARLSADQRDRLPARRRQPGPRRRR